MTKIEHLRKLKKVYFRWRLDFRFFKIYGPWKLGFFHQEGWDSKEVSNWWDPGSIRFESYKMMIIEKQNGKVQIIPKNHTDCYKFF